MQFYKNKIIGLKKETEVNKKIKNYVLIAYAYIFSFVIGSVIVLAGMISILLNCTKGWIFYGLGLGILVFDILVLLIFDSKDPLSGYTVNDKLFIYLDILKNECIINKSNELLHKQKIVVIIGRINLYLNEIENNIENCFVFRDDNHKLYINVIEKIRMLFKQKGSMLACSNENNEFQDYIADIICLYGRTLTNDFCNENCSVNNNEPRYKEIIDLLTKTDNIYNESKEFDSKEKEKLNFKFHMVHGFIPKIMTLIAIIFITIIITIFTGSTMVNQISTIISSICSIFVVFSASSNKKNDECKDKKL